MVAARHYAAHPAGHPAASLLPAACTPCNGSRNQDVSCGRD
jgi:hypothetical protein